MNKTMWFLAFVVTGAIGCSKEGGSSGSAAASAQPAAAATGGTAAKPSESDFCGLKFPPGAEVQDASNAGGELQVKLVSNEGFNKVEQFFGNQLYASTDQTMSNKDELRTKTWDKPSPDGKCKLKVDIKGDPTPKKVVISIVKKAG